MKLYTLLLPPLLAPLFSRIASRRLRPAKNIVLEWLFAAFFSILLTFAVCLPTGRMTMRYYHDAVPQELLVGGFALAFESTLCALLGVVQGLRHPLRVNRTPASGRKRLVPVLLRALAHIALLVLLFLTMAFFWATDRYDQVSLEELVFYVIMPLAGTAQSFTIDLRNHVLIPCALIFLLFQLLAHFPARRPLRLEMKGAAPLYVQLFPLRLPLASLYLILPIWLSLLLTGASDYLSIPEFFESRIHQSTFIEQHYVDPKDVALSFPQKKRNLIWIYMESAESSAQDVENGGQFPVNYIPEMTQLARENVSFSHSERIEGATVAPACGWTISGLVAQSSGLPLKMFAYNNLRADNIGSRLASFLPGATTLGDILQEAGYRNVFMAGSDFTFGGRRQYYTQHGDYEIWDLLTAYELGKIPPNYGSNWGFEDRKLYAYAKEMLLELAQDDQPFNLSLLTVDTHAPGYPCELCIDIDDTDYARSVICSSRQVSEFVDWCRQQPFYENTTIIITGDHASMEGTFYTYDAWTTNDAYVGTTSHLVYNAFIHSAVEPVREQHRRFTTLDFFPTALASLGVSIEGDQLALGVNLFSDAPTLSEIYGYDVLFEELNKKSLFYNREILYP